MYAIFQIPVDVNRAELRLRLPKIDFSSHEETDSFSDKERLCVRESSRKHDLLDAQRQSSLQPSYIYLY